MSGTNLPVKPLPLQQTGDPKIDDALRFLFELQNALKGNPFINGALLKDANGTLLTFTFTAAQVRSIQHPLGKAYQSVVPLLLRSPVTGAPAAFETVANPANFADDQWFTVKSTNASTVAFWVF